MNATAVHPVIEEAYGVLATGTPINPPLATRLSGLPGENVLDLISLAHKVRLKYAPGLHACSIVNAKSGACPENCRFCAQSAHHAAQVPEYGLLDPAELLSRAEAVWRQGVRRFGIVTAGTGTLPSSGVPGIGISTLSGFVSTPNSRSSNASATRSAIVSPTPMIPPQHSPMPLRFSVARATRRSAAVWVSLIRSR